MKASLATLALAVGGSCVCQGLPTQSIGVNPPRLVVLISIDQFRADYLDRFSPYFLAPKQGGKVGGFRYLIDTGVRYTDAHHEHIPTATGPGHATLMTGSEPSLDGIIGNDWFDRASMKPTYCVDDPTVTTVGGKSKPMSPRNLKVTTVGDELKLATGGKSKVVGISFKDRAAILMAGHSADTVVWFEGNKTKPVWVTSSFFAPNNQLPSWAKQMNDEDIINKSRNQTWEPLLPASAYALTKMAPGETPAPNGLPFGHNLGSDASFPSNYATSGFGQSYVFDAVSRAVDAEKLGQHDVPDVLVVNLATNDYVGHKYGPNSPEVMDITVRTDRLLSGLFNKLNKTIPGGLDSVAIVVTADHGVLPVPEEERDAFRGPSDRLEVDFKGAVNSALAAKFGEGDWVLGSGLYEQNLYLNRALIQSKSLKPEEVEEVAAEAASALPGVYLAVTRHQILHNQLPNWDWTREVANGYNPTLGGDIMVLETPGTLFGSGHAGTSHGSPWAYDTHVPILTHWKGQQPQWVSRRVFTHDIASTLSQLLGIEYPSGNMGKPLSEALPKR